MVSRHLMAHVSSAILVNLLLLEDNRNSKSPHSFDTDPHQLLLYSLISQILPFVKFNHFINHFHLHPSPRFPRSSRRYSLGSLCPNHKGARCSCGFLDQLLSGSLFKKKLLLNSENPLEPSTTIDETQYDQVDLDNEHQIDDFLDCDSD
jgi:hypothetical protein